jgi:signal transduction histidine kinase
VRSIRKRILRPVLPLTALALFLTGVGVNEALRIGLERALDQRLPGMNRSVGASVLVMPDGRVEFERKEVDYKLRMARTPDVDPLVFYQVRDEAGAVIASSLTEPLEPLPYATTRPQFLVRRVAGRDYRVCVLAVLREPEKPVKGPEVRAEAPASEPSRRRFSVVVGLETLVVEETLALFRTRMVAGFGILFLTLSFVPWWLVGRGLRPLERLSSEAEAIGPGAPEARLEEGGVDMEVQALVSAFNRALDRLRQGIEWEKRFTADAAHELRTPLSIIRAQCEVVLRRPREAGELRKALESVHGICLSMSTIVEGLLALARFQEMTVRPPMAPFNLATIAFEAVKLHRTAAQAKGVELLDDLPSDLPVRGDESLLLACVSKFVENAIRYTQPGGRVTVRGTSDPVAVVVEDTGIGIAEDQWERIFDRFYRVDTARSRAEGGAGLGLAIAKEIARVHGADIHVESHPGRGSRFELRFSKAGLNSCSPDCPQGQG